MYGITHNLKDTSWNGEIACLTCIRLEKMK